jgi:hypothetical protein
MSKKIRNISEDEIDELVIAHADDDSAWEKPVRARKSKSSAASSPAEPASGDSQEESSLSLKVNE